MNSGQIRNMSTRDNQEKDFLREIAAQLAETLEHHKRFVGFTFKERAFLVNVSEVSAVGMTDSGKGYISLCGRPFSCDQTYEEVLKRLAIEDANAK